MSLTLVTAPTVEPVTLAEMKLQCGFGPLEDSDHLKEQMLAEQLRDAITAARMYVEGELHRALITQTWLLTLDTFPYGTGEYSIRHQHDIVLPLGKFQELTAFTYVDASGDEQDMLDANSWGYQLVSSGDTRPARLRPPLYMFWPPTQLTHAESVSITFTCGYGNTPASVPAPIRSDIRMKAQHIFENRPGPFPVTDLLSDYIIPIV